MGPKKQEIEEWFECVKCQHVIHKSDKVQHSENCSAEHGFVYNNVLHARVAQANTQTKAIRSKLPLHDQDSIVLVHSSAMSLCDLALGQPCLVNRHHILTAWPCNSLPATGTLLPPLLTEVITGSGCTKSCTVAIQRISPPRSEAEQVEVELESEDEIYHKDGFTGILRCRMEGKYITENMKSVVRYMGRKCTFSIRTIQRLHPQSIESTAISSPSAAQSDPEELSQNLSSLNISSVSESGDSSFCSLTSTPSRQSGDCGNLDVTQSPATPVSQKDKRSDQFHTPVLVTHKSEDFSRFVKVTSQTQFTVQQKEQECPTQKKKVMFSSVGGLDSQIETLQTKCLQPLQSSQQDGSLGGPVSRGILLFGPTGTGKSLLAQAIANELGIYTAHISPTDLFSKFFGETEKKMRSVFQSALERSPSLIIVDHIDALCPRRDSSQSDLEKRTVLTFLSMMDRIAAKSSREVCIVIGITSKPDSLDPAFRRAGRFDLEIETGVPTASDRLQILKKLLQDVPYTMSESELKSIADKAHGYVGADLLGVVSQGRQHRWELTRDESALLTVEDLKHVTRQICPSAMREVQFEIPQVRWSDIGGQEEVKLKLQQSVEWPLTHPEAFQQLGISPPKGCLMYGPPGCSKTMIAKALATESGLNFLAVKGPELFGKYVGESEKAVREIFRKARAAAPSIIFFDEIDSLAVQRGRSGDGNSVADRVLTQLLTEMDGVVQLQGVTVVAATNRPDMIDKALLRPGRFDRVLYVPLPDAATRREILQIVIRKTPVAPDVSLEELVKQTENYSGAELTAVCYEAALCAMTENREARMVHMRHFESALQTVWPQTTQKTIKFYEDYAKHCR